jgi:hypothetical protein
MRAFRWFDAWVLRGPFVARDVAVYRIVFGVLVLLFAPRFTELAAYPNSLFDPPPGPFGLLTGFPPEGVLIAIEILMYVLMAATLLGLYTTFSSISLSVVLVGVSGLSYCLGKVDHLMVLAIVPAVMAFAGWGDTLSIDALRNHRVPDETRPAGSTPPMVPKQRGQPQWPLRFLALAIGVAFSTAVVPKVLGGWLSVSSRATYGYQVQRDYVGLGSNWLSSTLVNVHVPAIWEALDWVTVLLEGSIVLCAFSWRAWRIAIAVLTLFHLSIGLSLNIFFAGNVIAYGAFVSWSRIPLPTVRLSTRTNGFIVRGAVPLVLLLGALLWLLSTATSSVPRAVPVGIVIAGAALGLGYLSALALRLLRRLTSSATQISPQKTS